MAKMKHLKVGNPSQEQGVPRAAKDMGMKMMPDPTEVDHEAQGALDTLMKAHEHMANPDMMARVKSEAKKKMKAIKSVHDLRQAYNNHPDREDQGDNSKDEAVE